MTRFLVTSRALLEAAAQPGLLDDDVEALRLTESDGDDGSNTSKRTVALAVISALLILALVIYGCFRMCRSASAMERAANFLTVPKGASRAEGSYMSYTSNDGSNFQDAPVPHKNRLAKPLPTLAED